MNFWEQRFVWQNAGSERPSSGRMRMPAENSESEKDDIYDTHHMTKIMKRWKSVNKIASNRPKTAE